VRTIVSQVTRGLEVMTLLILACGILVMFSAVSLSMSERLQESAILRTIGSSQRLILGVQCIEFTSLGALAGLLAALGAETALLLIEHYLLQLPLTGHAWMWLAGPLSGGFLVGALGVAYSRKSVLLPPLDVLRRL
jgi:putative ABC transport system permease protein